jgi:hypothetical protein
LALLAGAGLGVRALIDPAWAAKFVRLKADEQGGGQAEFRATFGGVFLGLHFVALVLTLFYLESGAYLIGVCGRAQRRAWLLFRVKPPKPPPGSPGRRGRLCGRRDAGARAWICACSGEILSWTARYCACGWRTWA